VLSGAPVEVMDQALREEPESVAAKLNAMFADDDEED